MGRIKEATISQLKSTVPKQKITAAHQQEQIEALSAGLQKVSAQVELSQSAPQTVLHIAGIEVLANQR